MSEKEIGFVARLKETVTSDASQEVAEFARRTTETIRRTAEVGMFFAEASGIVIDQVLQLMIESGLRTIEFISAAIAAQTAGTLGLNVATGKIFLQFAAVALMFAQINALRNQKAEAARRLGYATSGLRALTF